MCPPPSHTHTTTTTHTPLPLRWSNPGTACQVSRFGILTLCILHPLLVLRSHTSFKFASAAICVGGSSIIHLINSSFIDFFVVIHACDVAVQVRGWWTAATGKAAPAATSGHQTVCSLLLLWCFVFRLFDLGLLSCSQATCSQGTLSHRQLTGSGYHLWTSVCGHSGAGRKTR